MGTRSIDKARLTLTFSGILSNLLTDGTTESEAALSLALATGALTSGTTESKADRIWISKGREILSGNSETIDVYDFGSIDIGAGAGKDCLGQSMALAEIVLLLVISSSESDGILNVGGDGTTAAWNSIFGSSDTAYSSIAPSGALLFFNPDDPAYLVADTSNHLLKMAAPSGDVTYSIAIVGRSA